MKDRILFLVESPNKIPTLKKILPPNYIVKASVGHITELKDGGNYYNTGIDPSKRFKANYVVSEDKKDIVEQLKNIVKTSDKVILASDGDREGEAIAYHLKTILKIPDDKYERITYQEVTKKAVLDALNHPRKIDSNLVDAAFSRQKLDKLLGYRLSPIARQLVSARSVGRCQSAGLVVLVDREEEIRNFKSDTYYDIYLHFIKNDTEFKAKYVGTDNKPIDRIKDINEVNEVIDNCNNNFIVGKIETQEKETSPKLPFTTSTFQQEVSSKLGIGVKQAMSYAQKLFEGIDINGEHIALISYHRTDSTTIDHDFAKSMKDFIIKKYGENYYAPVRKEKKKKDDTSQQGHECLRCIDLNMTPTKLSKSITDKNLLKVYTIIYNRTLASSMANSKYSETTYSIYNGKYKFNLVSKEELFDGFKKVYSYDKDDEEVVKITFKKNEKLNAKELEPVKKETQPPKRFSEATLIKQLDKLGIGRPSTYATIVSTLLDESRGYTKVDNKVLVPTDKGIELVHFLKQNFPDLINTKYTVEMEKDLDKIADGKLSEVDFLSNFLLTLDKDVDKMNLVSDDDICPNCGTKLILKNGKYGMFKACPNYPKCKYTKKVMK